MALVQSLLTAIVRADGDALVMHVGERPYVVASAGPIELSTQGLNLQAMAGMTAHLLPPEAQRSLSEFGAVEHELLPRPEMQGDRFTVVVARGGDDVWIEIRRQRRAAVESPAPATFLDATTADTTREVEAASGSGAVAGGEATTVADAQASMTVMADRAQRAADASPDTTDDALGQDEPPLETNVTADVSVPDHADVESIASFQSVAEVDAAEPVAPAEHGAGAADVAPAEGVAPAENVVVAAEHATPAEHVVAETVALAAIDTAAAAPGADHAGVAYASEPAPLVPVADVAIAASASVADEPHAADVGASAVATMTHDVDAIGTSASSEVEAAPQTEACEAESADAVSVQEDLSATAQEEQAVPTQEPLVPAAMAVQAEEEETLAVGGTHHTATAARYGVSAASTSAHASIDKSGPGAGGPAAVIPMMRTLRIEVPPPAPPRPTMPPAPDIDRLLAVAAARGATALYLTTHASPYIRVDADVHVLDGEPPLTSTDVESAVTDLVPDTTAEDLRRGEPSEWVADVDGIGPVRCTTFRDHRGPGAIFQLISSRPMRAEHLGLSEEIRGLATEIEGLVLVASPRANGKTTVLGSLVDLINRQRPAYVITLERQIRVVHEHRSALISQREVRGTKEELLTVARSAVRENPDVLVVEDLSSSEMCQLVLDAAGAGVLVVASVTAASTTAALARLVDLYPADERNGVQALLAERLRGAVAQVLLRKVGGGRVAAREVLLTTSSVASTIASGQLEDLPVAIDSARRHGLMSMTEALVQLVRTGAIDLREAYRKTDDRGALIAALKRENLETTLIERLA